MKLHSFLFLERDTIVIASFTYANPYPAQDLIYVLR
jgi:hypothetical protein